MTQTAAGKRAQMMEEATKFGLKARFGFGSAPKNRLYFTFPTGRSAFADNITELRSAIRASFEG